MEKGQTYYRGDPIICLGGSTVRRTCSCCSTSITMLRECAVQLLTLQCGHVPTIPTNCMRLFHVAGTVESSYCGYICSDFPPSQGSRRLARPRLNNKNYHEVGMLGSAHETPFNDSIIYPSHVVSDRLTRWWLGRYHIRRCRSWRWSPWGWFRGSRCHGNNVGGLQTELVNTTAPEEDHM